MVGMTGVTGTARGADTARPGTVTVALDESAPVDRRRLAALLDGDHAVVPLTCALAGVVEPDVVVVWPGGTVPADQLATIWPGATPVHLESLPDQRVWRPAGEPEWRPDLRGLADRITALPAPTHNTTHQPTEEVTDRATDQAADRAAGGAGWWADGGVVRVRASTHRLWPAGLVFDDADLVVWGGPHPDAVGCTVTATGYGHRGEPVRLRLIASAGRRAGHRVTLHGWSATGDDRVHLLLDGRLRTGTAGPDGTTPVELTLTGRAPDSSPFTLHLRARQATRGPVPEPLAVQASS
jgi:hypothetical protein